MRPKILVVGDVMLDRYHHGTVTRISPEAPIPILCRTHIEDRVGGAANVAANLASLGADVMLVGAVGCDDAGSKLSAMCGNIVQRHLTLAAPVGRTTVKERYVCAGQQMLRVDQDGARPTEVALFEIEQAVCGHIKTASAMVLSDYAGGVLAAPQGLIRRARGLGVPVYVDPKGTDWDRYRGATLIKPNEAELRAMADWSTSEEMLEIAVSILGEYDIAAMLVTHGAGGMTWVNQTGARLHQPAVSGPVVDVTGAGDTVLACVTHLRSMGLAWPVVLELASMGAAAVCARHGTSKVVPADIGISVMELEPA